VIWGNPYLRVLRRQLEQYIAEELGPDRLRSGRNQAELRKIKKEMADLQKRLDELQARRTEIEKAMRK
jgi:ubiquinone biosynthesis protein UbiJ